MSSNDLVELDSAITPAPPEDVIPESKLSQVPSMSGATKPEITPISGQKRTWSEKASPEPEMNRF